MKLALPIALLLALIVGGGYFWFMHPPVALKRTTNQALQGFADAIATHDRAKIGAALQELLTEDAQVRLAVTFFTLPQTDRPPVVQDFTKHTFIPFIDNVLYPLSDYHYEPFLGEFKLAEDRQSAEVTFTSREWADGVNYYGGTAVGMRFSSDTICTGKVVFGVMPQVALADCKYTLRMVPKPGELHKLREPMQQLLHQHEPTP